MEARPPHRLRPSRKRMQDGNDLVGEGSAVIAHINLLPDDSLVHNRVSGLRHDQEMPIMALGKEQGHRRNLLGIGRGEPIVQQFAQPVRERGDPNPKMGLSIRPGLVRRWSPG